MIFKFRYENYINTKTERISVAVLRLKYSCVSIAENNFIAEINTSWLRKPLRKSITPIFQSVNYHPASEYFILNEKCFEKCKRQHQRITNSACFLFVNMVLCSITIINGVLSW